MRHMEKSKGGGFGVRDSYNFSLQNINKLLQCLIKLEAGIEPQALHYQEDFNVLGHDRYYEILM